MCVSVLFACVLAEVQVLAFRYNIHYASSC
jgi:hypothetical protein